MIRDASWVITRSPFPASTRPICLQCR
jgi:hypothetical protein